jgi:predicted DCC family thiol-disulfide oxidoreductase YuxK
MEEPIVFYDGDCGLCNRSVAFILKHEKEQVIRFAAIQSDFTTELFKKNNWEAPDLSTVYFYENGKLNIKSTAALKIARYLKAPRSWMVVFFIIPRCIRDGVYNFIAKRRKRISKGYCVMPKPGDKERFLT